MVSLPPLPTATGIRSLGARYASVVLDLIYPPRCELCEVALPRGRHAEARWLCDACLGSVRPIEPPFCSTCGEMFDGAITGPFRCPNCADVRFSFEFAIAAVKAEGGARELVHRFKYQRALHLRGVLAALLAKTLADPRIVPSLGSAVLVPVPLHHTRQRDREYNQARELCRELTRQAGLPTLDALRRVRSTTPQASLSRHQRLENLRHAFAPAKWAQRALAGKTVLLVDDVLTTGTTTSECARVLRKAAAVEKVVVITVARG